MKIGVIIGYHCGVNLADQFQQARDLGLDGCQLNIWDRSLYTDEQACIVRQAAAQTGLEISALWAGWSGPAEWNFTGGPATLGLVPPAYRGIRLQELLAASEFAAKIGVSDMITHVGFLPETPDDPNYNGVVVALRHLASVMKTRGQYFLFETGQETPVTLLRTIEDITANLLLYGKANPVDGLKVLGRYVRALHAKDGFYPTDPHELGQEAPIPEGEVDFPAVIASLKALDFRGSIIIECELSGTENDYILKTKEYLERLISEAYGKSAGRGF